MDPATVRVYVGATPSELLPLKVLEHTIKEHSTLPVEMSFMADLEYPLPKDEKNQPGTKFSFYRFMIPQFTGYQGRALYLDSDMMVFKDIRELWQIPFDGAQVLTVRTPEGGATKNHSVLLIDCAAVDWDIRRIVQDLDAGKYDYDRLMRDLCIVPPDRALAKIPYVWNSLDTYEPGATALLHFTALHSQPWTATRHPLAKVWVEALHRTVATGAVTLEMVQKEVESRHVRPSLLYQLESGKLDPATVPADVLQRDRDFVAPYRTLSKNSLVHRVQRKVRHLARNMWSR
jgi:lipopolysaccharide biosynthesis glycosyltransferase